MDAGKPFDVVILDLTIPGGMGGKETVGKLLDINSDVIAVAASGYSNDPVFANPQKFGFCGVIPKPFKLEELRDVLHSVLQAKND